MRRFFQLLFMPCDGITGLVSESLDRELTRVERFGVRLHLLYCVACRRFRKHIRQIRTALGEADRALASSPELRLSPQARARIVDSLKR